LLYHKHFSCFDLKLHIHIIDVISILYSVNGGKNYKFKNKTRKNVFCFVQYELIGELRRTVTEEIIASGRASSLDKGGGGEIRTLIEAPNW
jgi:hypothetical protein